MKAKKVLAMMMTMAMACGMLTGCGSSGDTGTALAPEQQESATAGDDGEASSEGGEGGKITICTWNDPNPNEELNMYLQCEKAT